MTEWTKAKLWLAGLAIVSCTIAVLCAGCTFNHITFETDCFKFTDELTVEPGQGGDASDTGATSEGSGVGGTGKMSPGGSNQLDGEMQYAIIIQQGGETPSSIPITVDATVTPGG